MVEKEIDIDIGNNKLSGTLCLPEDKGRFPCVLMVHGSGPLDRNENMRGQHLNIFNAIAHQFSTAGIASLRYDKRGCGKSSGDYYTATHLNLVEDAIACFDFLEKTESCIANEIYVLGHSEGSIIAPQMSIKRSSIAGIILLCPFVQDMESILIMQARHVQEAINGLKGIRGIIYRTFLRPTGNPVASQRKLINKLKSSSALTFRYWLTKVPAAQLRDLLKIVPQDIFSQVTCPALLIGGEKDIQCDPADVGRIAELTGGRVDAHVINDLTHILRIDERKPSIFSYAELIRKPVEPAVIDLAIHWLRQK